MNRSCVIYPCRPFYKKNTLHGVCSVTLTDGRCGRAVECTLTAPPRSSHPFRQQNVTVRLHKESKSQYSSAKTCQFHPQATCWQTIDSVLSNQYQVGELLWQASCFCVLTKRFPSPSSQQKKCLHLISFYSYVQTNKPSRPTRGHEPSHAMHTLPATHTLTRHYRRCAKEKAHIWIGAVCGALS